MLEDMQRAKIVITNYHAFMLRERMEVSAGTRGLLKGRSGEDLQTKETEGQMLQRVVPDLMGMKNVLVINDEAHHCYRSKPLDDDDEAAPRGTTARKPRRTTKKPASGSPGSRFSIASSACRVFDLSATPFFLQGSGYAEGTLFPWTMSDFSLMDAIECGIVKLPRVPVAENIPGDEMPMFRMLWQHIRARHAEEGPRHGRQPRSPQAPRSAPDGPPCPLRPLRQDVQALAGEQDRGPPCFIIVCQNTAISKLVFDYVSGFERENSDGTTSIENGRLPLFRNFDAHAPRFPSPTRSSSTASSLNRATPSIPASAPWPPPRSSRFRREIVERTGRQQDAADLSDQDLLREVMNTVGKPGTLGGGIRCVVSVAMLTEGWDANTVTHVLGVRAFGTQLLCEQVIGRSLRRQSYELNEKGLFNVEYADVFGIPFDFTAKPVIAPPQPPMKPTVVKAIKPDRDHLEIRFPRVEGYRVELPEDHLEATFSARLDPRADARSRRPVDHAKLRHHRQVGRHEPQAPGGDAAGDGPLRATSRLLYTKFRDAGEEPKLHLFGQLKRITKQWLDTCLVCKGGTYPALLLYEQLADMACHRITTGITEAYRGDRPVVAMLDAYNATGSTRFVNFNTSRNPLWQTAPDKCHVNWVIYDSEWEAELCRVVEGHPQVRSYVKNHNLGFEVPYRYGSEVRKYFPDFIVHVDDGHGDDDLLRLVVEIKGYRREDAKEKAATMATFWVPGVNQLGTHGRWSFAELTEVYKFETDFAAKVGQAFDVMLDEASASHGAATAVASR